MAILLYLVICLLVALTGKDKPIGYWPVFILSVILSPVIGLIIGLASKDHAPTVITFRCTHCGLESKENSYYCPRCGLDNEGQTKEQNNAKYAKN